MTTQKFGTSVSTDAYHTTESSKNKIPNQKSNVLPVGSFSNIKFEHLIAGISGGVASTLALHPLDLLKVRLAGMF